MDETTREMYRSRWRRERKRLGLSDIRQDNFAKGGIAQFLPNLSVRFVILAADPDCELIDFDSDFWSWWKTDRATPFGTSPEEWGRVIPMTNAAVRSRLFLDKPWSWDCYIALCRHGGLDLGLGNDGAVRIEDNKLLFLLIRIVGRLWSALDLYGEIIKRLKINGPWECSLALLGTAGALLGNFATGWLDYPNYDANPHPCPEPNLWRRWELEEWPTQYGLRDIALSAGSWIENSWGMQSRRFIARTGPFEGQFDASNYR